MPIVLNYSENDSIKYSIVSVLVKNESLLSALTSPGYNFETDILVQPLKPLFAAGQHKKKHDNKPILLFYRLTRIPFNPTKKKTGKPESMFVFNWHSEEQFGNFKLPSVAQCHFYNENGENITTVVKKPYSNNQCILNIDKKTIPMLKGTGFIEVRATDRSNHPLFSAKYPVKTDEAIEKAAKLTFSQVMRKYLEGNCIPETQ